ncbi:metallophosphoesterase family protein [Bacillus sp. 1P06AnD]|uniref:metallophosphoesterase family protein n=1 Tax=Bacillus sp. 1P06AnD TaxID=3132208 RepID=UPI0039A38995
MRKLFISDIHGCFNEMNMLLKQSDFDPAVDQLIVGGDLIDRGPDSAKVLAYMKGLQENNPDKVIVLLGNHEDMLNMYIKGINTMWLGHGKEAIRSFKEYFTDEMLQEHIEWLFRQSVIYGDDEFVYVHAGIIPSYALNDQPREEVLWMPYSRSGVRFSAYGVEEILRVTHQRKVVHGHTPTASIKDDGARICCDLGAGVYKDRAKLALADLSGGFYYYYDFSEKKIKTAKILSI